MSRTSTSKQQAELVLCNGNFITLDDDKPRASAIAVKDGRILRIGDYEDVKGLIGKNTLKLDLKGKTVVPGFIDAHIHLISLGLAMQVLDLRAISSKSDILVRVKDKAILTSPGSWIRGYGFDESLLELPAKHELDTVSPENPVYLEAVNHKICILNSLALLKVGAKNDSVGVKMDRYHKNGEINGVIRVDNRNLLIDAVRIPTIEPLDEKLEEAELVEAIMIAYPKIVEQGITTIHDVQMPPNGLRAYNKVVSSGEMPLRVYVGCDRNKEISIEEYMDEGLGSEPHPERLKIGLVKLFADGRMPLEEFSRRVKEAHEAGYQLAIHSDDKTQVENALLAIEKAIEFESRKNHRHRVEHAHIIDGGLIERIEKLELVVSSQPERVFGSDASFPDFLVVPLHSLGERGVVVAGGSDASTYARCTAGFPVNYSNPLTGICFEVSRKNYKGINIQHGESISIIEALKLHSLNGAYASFEEDLKGSLKEGKLADIVVLSHDPFIVDPENIKDIEVEKTIIGGRLVYSKN